MSRTPSPLIPGEVASNPARRAKRRPLLLGVALLVVLWLLMAAYLDAHMPAPARQAQGAVSPAQPIVPPAVELRAPGSSAAKPALPAAPAASSAQASSSDTSYPVQMDPAHLALQAEIDTRLAASPLEFRYMKLALRSDSLRALTGRIAAAGPQIAVLVRVHAHSWGSTERNLDISVRRAEVVRRTMIAAGLSASRVSAEGVGEAEPSQGRSERETRQLNRRTEIRIVRS